MPYDILEVGIVEYIGINESVTGGQYTTSKAVVVAAVANARPRSGVIRSVDFIGNGALNTLAPAIELLFLDADPAVALDDASITAAEWATIFGRISVATGDWDGDANGGIVAKHDLFLPFHELESIYLVAKPAVAVNNLAGDDEQLQINLWYEHRN